ncbi:hypothetical protein [Phascolarctobacterium sp.]
MAPRKSSKTYTIPCSRSWQAIIEPAFLLLTVNFSTASFLLTSCCMSDTIGSQTKLQA